jgi:hypothetical protein
MPAMNLPNNRMSQALRELAAESPQGAPPELSARLHAAFARHHRVRRQKRAAFVIGIAAVLALSGMVLRMSKPAHLQVQAPPPAPANVQPSAPQQAKPAEPVAATHDSGASIQPKRRVGSNRRAPLASGPSVATGDFIALSSFDPAIPLGQARIVRMELPGAALRRAGFPVNAELMQQPVVTDVLVGQDGRPYAARLVQTRMVH